jgi:hypothetical protein
LLDEYPTHALTDTTEAAEDHAFPARNVDRELLYAAAAPVEDALADDGPESLFCGLTQQATRG